MANEKRLIDAKDAEKALFELRKGFRRTDEKCAVGGCILELRELPTVDAVEMVHGEWIRCLDVDDVEYIECPICGGEFYDGDNDTFDKPYNYCPNCGAKMDGDGNG